MSGKCPSCGGQACRVQKSQKVTTVTETFITIARRRFCEDCGYRWTTVEVPLSELKEVHRRKEEAEERLLDLCEDLYGMIDDYLYDPTDDLIDGDINSPGEEVERTILERVKNHELPAKPKKQATPSALIGWGVKVQAPLPYKQGNK